MAVPNDDGKGTSPGQHDEGDRGWHLVAPVHSHRFTGTRDALLILASACAPSERVGRPDLSVE